LTRIAIAVIFFVAFASALIEFHRLANRGGMIAYLFVTHCEAVSRMQANAIYVFYFSAAECFGTIDFCGNASCAADHGR